MPADDNGTKASESAAERICNFMRLHIIRYGKASKGRIGRKSPQSTSRAARF